MSVPSMNIGILAKYCKDVNFDFQRCLKVYLKQVLVAWKPEFEVKTNTTTGEKGKAIDDRFQKHKGRRPGFKFGFVF